MLQTSWTHWSNAWILRYFWLPATINKNTTFVSHHIFFVSLVSASAKPLNTNRFLFWAVKQTNLKQKQKSTQFQRFRRRSVIDHLVSWASMQSIQWHINRGYETNRAYDRPCYNFQIWIETLAIQCAWDREKHRSNVIEPKNHPAKLVKHTIFFLRTINR